MRSLWLTNSRLGNAEEAADARKVSSNCRQVQPDRRDAALADPGRDLPVERDEGDQVGDADQAREHAPDQLGSRPVDWQGDTLAAVGPPRNARTGHAPAMASGRASRQRSARDATHFRVVRPSPDVGYARIGHDFSGAREPRGRRSRLGALGKTNARLWTAGVRRRLFDRLRADRGSRRVFGGRRAAGCREQGASAFARAARRGANFGLRSLRGRKMRRKARGVCERRSVSAASRLSRQMFGSVVHFSVPRHVGVVVRFRRLPGVRYSLTYDVRRPRPAMLSGMRRGAEPGDVLGAITGTRATRT